MIQHFLVYYIGSDLCVALVFALGIAWVYYLIKRFIK